MEEFETVMQTRDEVEFCITVENSPNPRVFISGYANTGKNVFYCFYKVTVRKKKNTKLFVMALIKREILTAREVLEKKYCARQSVLVLQKRCFPKYGFFSLKMSA